MLSFNPSGIEQELFQLVNRFRTDPQGELSRLVNNFSPISSLDPYINRQLQYWGVSGNVLAAQWQDLAPVPPLAWSEALHESAHDHNHAMLVHDGQQHQFPGELDPGARMRAAGYDWQRWGENIYAYPRSAHEAHGGFVIDWGAGPAGIQEPPNHRIRLLREEFVHIGVAIDDVGYDAARSVGPLIVTQDLATPRMATSSYAVGAVYKQQDGSPWYVAGSGYGSVHVVFEGAAGTFETTSMNAGGFQIQLPPGTYRGIATGGSLPAPLVCDEFVVGRDNVSIDFVYPVDRGRIPVAANDAFVTDVATARTLNVLGNDRDTDGTLVPSTLTIVSVPTAGEVQMHTDTGRVTYVPRSGFSGLDKFTYRVRDDDGLTSNLATVRVMVIDLDGHPWQNPVNRWDVNLDETVSAADALQIINALNSGHGMKLAVPPAASKLPPPLLDVSGDNLLTPRDALLVINYLSDSGTGEGEDARGALGDDDAPQGPDVGLGAYGTPASFFAVTTHSTRPARERLAAADSPAPGPVFEPGLYADSSRCNLTAMAERAATECRARRPGREAAAVLHDEVLGGWPDAPTAD